MNLSMQLSVNSKGRTRNPDSYDLHFLSSIYDEDECLLTTNTLTNPSKTFKHEEREKDDRESERKRDSERGRYNQDQLTL